MIVTESVLERTLFVIFRDRNMRSGSCMPLMDLQYYWMSTGLRGDDLRDAVRYLSRRGFILLRNGDDQSSLELTPRGARRLDEFRRILPEDAHEIEDVLAMTEARHRRSEAAGQTARRERRAGDGNAVH